MTPEEQAAADAAAAKAKAEADAKAKDPAYLESELKKVIAERDAAKLKVKELTPAAAKLKEIEDAAKSDVQRLTDELAALKPSAARTAALEAQITGIFDAEIQHLTPEQRAAIVGETPEARLAHLRTLQAAGMIAKLNTSAVGANMPGAGGAGTITQSAWVKATSAQRAHYQQQVREGKLRVIPG